MPCRRRFRIRGLHSHGKRLSSSTRPTKPSRAAAFESYEEVAFALCLFTLYRAINVCNPTPQVCAQGARHTCSEGLGSPLTGPCGAAPFSVGAAALVGCAPSMSMGIGDGWLMLFTYVCRHTTAHHEAVLKRSLKLR